MELMKQKLCFRIVTKLGNSKRQHYSWQEEKNKVGPLFEKVHEEKEKKKER